MLTILKEQWQLVSAFVLVVGIAAFWGLTSGEKEDDPSSLVVAPQPAADPEADPGAEMVQGPFKPAPVEKEDDTETIIARYQRAIQDDPDSEEAALNLRRIANLNYTRLQNYAEAAKIYEELIRRFPDWKGTDRTFAALASCYERRGDSANERYTYERMLKHFAEDTIEYKYAKEKLAQR
ncbi:tetratricopeptide repeat protein [candidate division TA06 bacterium]|nr:tetratricopeptide repeat protein [candidate division TA06 bacterium]